MIDERRAVWPPVFVANRRAQGPLSRAPSAPPEQARTPTRDECVWPGNWYAFMQQCATLPAPCQCPVALLSGRQPSGRPRGPGPARAVASLTQTTMRLLELLCFKLAMS